MAITNAAAFQSYEAIGLREDLTDLIEDISPMECPALDRWGTTKATNRKHE